jgi:hypothetical protein
VTSSVEELKERNARALLERKKKLEALLPEGWKRVESRSRPGEFVYENIYTEERQAWLPTEAALKPGSGLSVIFLIDSSSPADT